MYLLYDVPTNVTLDWGPNYRHTQESFFLIILFHLKEHSGPDQGDILVQVVNGFDIVGKTRFNIISEASSTLHLLTII